MTIDIEISLLGRNEIAREGLKRILTGENFTIGSSVEDQSAIKFSAMDGGRFDRQHIIIVDDGSEREGLENCRTLGQRFPNSRLVLLADDFEFDEVATAFGAGVDGYIIKEISCEPLIESLKLVAMGEKVLPSQLAANLSSHRTMSGYDDWRTSVGDVGLSDREVEILRCLVIGLANKVISRRLSISEATVKVHVKAILRKLRVANRTQAAIWAVKHGLEGHLAGFADGVKSEDEQEDEDEDARPILDYAA